MTTTTGTVRDRLRSALRGAMRSRDAVALSAVRSALAALDNAEAVDLPGTAEVTVAVNPAATHASVAGTVAGAGATEVPRRVLTAGDLDAIVRQEIDERRAAATDLETAGHPERVARLRAEADVLDRCLNDE